MKKSLLTILLLLAPSFSSGQDLVRPVFIGNSTSSVGGPAPNTIMTETGAPADSRRWLWLLHDQLLHGQITKDNGSNAVDWVTITRSGDTITSVAFPQVTASALLSTSSSYHNWGTEAGSGGYGIRDNSGTMEFKNNAGIWQSFALPAPSGGGWVRSGTTIQPLTGTDAVVIGNLNNVIACDPGQTNGGAAILAAVTELPSTGGIVDCRGAQGAQTATSQILIAKANVTVLFGCSTWTLSGVTPAQGTPFVGANFQVTDLNNVWFKGTQGCTKLKLANGETSNVFVFQGSAAGPGIVGGGITGFELDGNKSNNTSGTDDGFQSGIQIIVTGGTADSAITVDNNIIHDFNHYGLVTYGAGQASGNTITNNRFYNNGKNDTYGTGDGVYINKGSSRNYIVNNRSDHNQRSGFHFSSAGITQDGNIVAHNRGDSNTLNGFHANEESSLGSIAGVGQTGWLWSGNHADNNTGYGYRIGTFDNVGLISGFSVTGNTASGNGADALLVQSNNDVTSHTSEGKILDNIFENNTGYGVNLGPHVLDMDVRSNTLATGNGSGAISDTATRTMQVCNKVSTGDAICSIPGPAIIDGVSFSSTGIELANTQTIRLNQTGTRDWTLNATGGNLLLGSGDDLGELVFTSAGGQTNAGPVTLKTVAFADLPASPVHGMVIVISDPNVLTWGSAVTAGGGVSGSVVAWYNSTTSHWDVISK